MWLNTPLVDALGHCPGLSIPSPQPCVIRPEATISPLRNSPASWGSDPLTRTQRQCWRKAEFPWKNAWSFKKYRISNFRGCPQLWHDGLIFIVFPYITIRTSTDLGVVTNDIIINHLYQGSGEVIRCIFRRWRLCISREKPSTYQHQHGWENHMC